MAKKLFSLGALYPSDFLKPGEQPRCEPVELSLVMEENGMVHLEHLAPKEAMWGKYWYRSSINPLMRAELKNIVDSVTSIMKFDGGEIWCDVAANDGTLLSFVPEQFLKIGIDPADDSFKEQSEQHADLIIQDYFSAEVYKQSIFGKHKINVLTSIAMFYDLEKPEDFINDVYEVLDDDGLWVLQISYTPIMLKQLGIDNVCHEHYAYYWLTNLKQLLSDGGFQTMDCQLNETNGGSFRIYAMKKNADTTKFGTRQYRDVCEFRIMSILALEDTLELDFAGAWHTFFIHANTLKKKTITFINAEKEKGKKIYGYGASTKFNTVLQYFNLTPDLITAIADRSPAKHGLRCVGSNIPIISEEQMRRERPDFLLIGPSHFLSEFKEREKEYLDNGGAFILLMPSFQIITNEK